MLTALLRRVVGDVLEEEGHGCGEVVGRVELEVEHEGVGLVFCLSERAQRTSLNGPVAGHFAGAVEWYCVLCESGKGGLVISAVESNLHQVRFSDANRTVCETVIRPKSRLYKKP